MNFANIRSQLSADARAAALQGIRTVLTEENTDVIVARMTGLVKARLPAYLRWLPVGTVLDALLPETLLRVFEEVLT